MSDACAVTVVIPTRGRLERLAGCLRALQAELPGAEVLLANNGPAFAGDVDALWPEGGLSVIECGQVGPAEARNLGAQQARSGWLLFLDGDCLPQPGWWAVLREAAEHQRGCCCGGRRVLPEDGNSLPEQVSQMISDAVMEYHTSAEDADAADLTAGSRRTTFLASHNMLLQRDDFVALGGFDARNFPAAGGEDRDFSRRWLAAGKPLVYAPDALIVHNHPLSFGAYLKMYIRYGRGAAAYYRLAARAGGERRTQAGFYRRLPALLRPHMRCLKVGERMVALFLLLAWQAANAAGFGLEWAVKRGRS